VGEGEEVVNRAGGKVNTTDRTHDEDVGNVVDVVGLLE
jgi:hypothetical protein